MEIDPQKQYILYKKYLKEAKELSEKYFKKTIWVTRSDAMETLKISSKSTLQKMRDNNQIVYSKVSTKIILYDLDSIKDYIERNSNRKWAKNL
jgi:tetrahydrodipicolinate N-succinyltransferase